MTSSTVSIKPWRERAACWDTRSDIFFKDTNGTNYDPARRVCRHCGVRPECLGAAMAAQFEEGAMFGGATPTDRTKLRKGQITLAEVEQKLADA